MGNRRRIKAGLWTAGAVAGAVLIAFGADRDGAATGLLLAPPDIGRLAAARATAVALRRAEESRDALVEEWIRIASIPAYSHQEEERARMAEKAMRSMGLVDVHKDAAGNVVGTIPGADRGAKKTVFMAHMDTVAKPGADFSVKRDGGTLKGPGVRDDSSGLAAVLAAARLLREAGATPPTDLFVVASVQEEVGLKGSQAFLDAAGKDVGAFVAVDGYLGQVSYAATSIVWTRMHFKAKGAHTLKSHESPSATLAAAKAIQAIYAIKPPRLPETMESWINVGMLGGGDVPNAQARDAWFTVDLRSNDLATTAELEKRILEACRAAAAEVGVAFESEDIQRLEGASIEGHRDSLLVRTARSVLEYLDWNDVNVTPRGTADHNIAIRMGIPAIALGVTTGDGAHTPDEVADSGPYLTGVKQLILLMASPLV